jgi:two-component system cell cycle sensor histidine kinase/response regulator CckA
MLLSSSLGDPDLLALNEIQKAADSAAAITRKLMQFSHKDSLRKQDINLNEVIGSMKDLFRRVGGRFVKWQFNLDENLGAVRADHGQLKQVLENLVTNARYSMPDGGTVTIETMNVDAPPAGAFPNAQEPLIGLVVTDTGTGMASQPAKQLFEPFFTTKESGSGAELGLSIVHSIVTDLGGTIHHDSNPGAGTTFTVHFPRAVESDALVIDEALRVA